MRFVPCILLTISHLIIFGPWKRVESMSHSSGLFFVTSPTAPKSGIPWINTSGLTASDCRAIFYHGRGIDKRKYGSQ